MKVLLFLNGPEGCQTGIEDGFKFLLDSDKISKLDWFYFDDFANKNSIVGSKIKMMELAIMLQPELIVFFHISKFSIDSDFIRDFKKIESKPKLVYDEGDMYGTWAKPITRSMKIIIKEVDVVSIRGLGKFENQIAKLNPTIIYTPHHNDIARFDSGVESGQKRKYDLILIGNRIKPRFLSFIRRLPGAKGRELFVKKIADVFSDRFKLFGNGWEGFVSNQGPVDFYKQNEFYRNTKITVAYEHYPNVSYYFSNRLPMALMNGSLYVCHYHEGYEKIFNNCNFIFFFNDTKQAIEQINNVLSLSEAEFAQRSENARLFAVLNYHPTVVWANFFINVLSHVNIQSY